MTSGCLLSRKVLWAVWSGSFCPKLRYFADQNGPKGGPENGKMDFDYFQIQKWMLQIVRGEKVD